MPLYNTSMGGSTPKTLVTPDGTTDSIAIEKVDGKTVKPSSTLGNATADNVLQGYTFTSDGGFAVAGASTASIDLENLQNKYGNINNSLSYLFDGDDLVIKRLTSGATLSNVWIINVSPYLNYKSFSVTMDGKTYTTSNDYYGQTSGMISGLPFFVKSFKAGSDCFVAYKPKQNAGTIYNNDITEILEKVTKTKREVITADYYNYEYNGPAGRVDRGEILRLENCYLCDLQFAARGGGGSGESSTDLTIKINSNTLSMNWGQTGLDYENGADTQCLLSFPMKINTVTVNLIQYLTRNSSAAGHTSVRASYIPL